MLGCCCEEASQQQTEPITADSALGEFEKTPGMSVQPAPTREEAPEEVQRAEKPAEYLTFEVKVLVDKASELGLDLLTPSKSHLLVKKVLPGRVAFFCSSKAELKLKPFDRILGVNDDGKSPGRAEEMKQKLSEASGSLTLKIEKPTLLRVTVIQTKTKHGLEVQAVPDLGVNITGITEGSVSAYNKRADAAVRVKAGDYIYGTYAEDASGKMVMKKASNSTEMINVLSQDGTLCLCVVSYS